MVEKIVLSQEYKKTPIGIIPEDWKLTRIKDFGTIITGSTPSTSNLSNYGNDFLFVSPADLSDTKYLTISNKRLSKKGFLQSRKIPKGSILFTCIGSTIGKMGIAACTLTCNQQINAIICDEKHYNEYLYYALNLNSNRIKLLAGEQAVPIINKTTFGNFKILNPPLPEQKKIAEILSLWDKAIEKQSQLIFLLQYRKKGLMQQLLTGKKRLSGSKGKWEICKLGDICKRVVTKNSEGNINVMTISAQQGFIRQTDFFNKSIASESLDGYYLVNKDEFCYNKSYSNGYPMGAIKRFKEADKAVVTTLYICFKVSDKKNTDLNFLEQIFDLGILNRGLTKVANEGGRAHGLLNVTPTDFFNLNLHIPSYKEQVEISKLIMLADRELKNAIKKLEHLRSQKRGLMQQLLTGKIRVK